MHCKAELIGRVADLFEETQNFGWPLRVGGGARKAEVDLGRIAGLRAAARACDSKADGRSADLQTAVAEIAIYNIAERVQRTSHAASVFQIS